jgi:glycosyltransferase involved in cell wall biosynthesis
MFSPPKKVFMRDFLVSVALANLVLADGEIRHLHAHFAHGATTVTWFASVITDQPFSFTAHAKDIYSERFNPRGLLRRKLGAARFVVTCTSFNREHLLDIAPDAEIHLVYHGLNSDFARLLESGPSRAGANGTPRILAVGRLVDKKGFDTLVKACAVLDSQGVNFEAAIVGQKGEASSAVRALIAEHGLEDRVRVAPEMTQAELHAQYLQADAFCLPCRISDDGDRDGIPNVLVEAMACSVPVVTTHVSGIPELVADGKNGLVVPPEDHEALADALLRVLKDPSLAGKLGRAGQATVHDRFDGQKLVGRLAALFERTIA